MCYEPAEQRSVWRGEPSAHPSNRYMERKAALQTEPWVTPGLRRVGTSKRLQMRKGEPPGRAAGGECVGDACLPVASAFSGSQHRRGVRRAGKEVREPGEGREKKN